MSVAANLARIRQTIGSSPVKLVAVTKNVEPALISEAYDHGVTEFGENRVQEALIKQETMPPYMADNINWHFIGHLQTNKVRKIVGRFALIHSVDSLRLAREISLQAEALGIVQPVLLQVKIVADPGKSGFSPDELRAAFAQIGRLPNLRVDGLMTMAPLTAERATWRRCFTGLKELRDELEREHGVSLPELSMGMSQDWEEALSCGATIIRLGRAVFGH